MEGHQEGLDNGQRDMVKGRGYKQAEDLGEQVSKQRMRPRMR